jgi:signal transduction histidine kinase
VPLRSRPSRPFIHVPAASDAGEEDDMQHPAVEVTQLPPLRVFYRTARFVAHDFRHLLSAIYANTELICSSRFPRYDREEMLEDIKAAIRCMTDTLDALAFRLETGQLFHLRRVTLNSIVHGAVQMARLHPDSARVEIIHEDMPHKEVHADPIWLGSAVFNLLLNACQAVQFHSAMKQVVVACHDDRDQVFLSIIDSGPGMSGKIQELLRQRREDLPHRARVGLGLAIVKSIVREHGGGVYLEEARPGTTCMVVRLPKPSPVGTDVSELTCMTSREVRVAH